MWISGQEAKTSPLLLSSQALDDALDEALDGLASSGWRGQRETAIAGQEAGANKDQQASPTDKK